MPCAECFVKTFGNFASVSSPAISIPTPRKSSSFVLSLSLSLLGEEEEAQTHDGEEKKEKRSSSEFLSPLAKKEATWEGELS